MKEYAKKPENKSRALNQQSPADQQAPASVVLQRYAPQPNNTGLPDNLKTGIESLSGYSMDDVKVHYNSGKPAQLNALAYAQGTDIHIAPGQEHHLPHEAWHVVQQKQGRVSPTLQLQGVNVNDNEGLETEADVMGSVIQRKVVQRVITIDTLLQQTGGNCGLFCIKMALDQLGSSELKINEAAEKAGSYVGEIFDYNTMKSVIEQLEFKSEQLTFNSINDLENLLLDKTGNNPVLIAFSNAHFLEKATVAGHKTPLGDSNLQKIDTQRGHWSIIESINTEKNIVNIANPWGVRFTIPLKELHEANNKLGSTPNEETPVFNWDTFIKDSTTTIYSSMNSNEKYMIEKKSEGTKVSKIITTSPSDSSSSTDLYPKTIENIKQPLDLAGYIVVISTK